jgi:hypothetical protein
MFNLPEDFLHFIWRSLHFDSRRLRTNQNQDIQIQSVGIWNHNQGPDFLQAKLAIDGVSLHGHVEIHIKSEDWYAHKHHLDPNYNGVVLHVVWEKGKRPIRREDGTLIPELVIAPFVSQTAIQRYHRLNLSTDDIPCSAQLPAVNESLKIMALEQMAMERVIEKASFFQERLQACKQDWNQLIWEEIAAMMGGPVNKEVFREIAQRLPYAILLKYRDQHTQLESLLFGITGLLISEKPLQDGYYQALREEWHFLRKKHKLAFEGMPALRFSRMRPASFPTLRLAQLASLIMRWPQLTDLLQETHFLLFLEDVIAPSPYWRTHYRFSEAKAAKNKPLGRSQKEILLINCLIPISWLYQQSHGNPFPEGLLEDGLAALPPEENRITRQFAALELRAAHAGHSQGMIQLKKKYCSQKACLKCQIGYHILSRKPAISPSNQSARRLAP